MKTLWIFNPENDIALSNNLLHFTPPRNALLLRRYGAMIMSWLADDGDYILSDDGAFYDINESEFDLTGTCLPKNLQIYSPRALTEIERIIPWGWSKAIVGELQHLGFSNTLLPSMERLEAIRQLSHRRSSIVINTRLEEKGFSTNIPTEITDIKELELILRNQSPVVIKSPWSSSGRGVLFSDDISFHQLIKLTTGILRNQGSVLVEPKLNGILDFAMLFEMEAGIARYVGLSIFDTIGKGNYSGNLVADEPTLSQYLSRYLPVSKITALQSALSEILADLIGSTYNGICGIDMMIYRADNGEYEIAPCIELNLRYTMGYVAHRLAERFVIPGQTARMEISYIGNRVKPISELPVLDPQGKLISGTLPLVSENDYFQIALTASNSRYSADVGNPITL